MRLRLEAGKIQYLLLLLDYGVFFVKDIVSYARKSNKYWMLKIDYPLMMHQDGDMVTCTTINFVDNEALRFKITLFLNYWYHR